MGPLSKTLIPERFQGLKLLSLDLECILYGKSHFSTLRVEKGLPLFLEKHLHRLEQGHQFLFKKSFNRETLMEDLRNYFGNYSGALRITFTQDFYFFVTRDFATSNGLRLCASVSKKSKGTIPNFLKHGNYLENLSELRLANSKGYDDIFFESTDGALLETSIRNLFFKKDQNSSFQKVIWSLRESPLNYLKSFLILSISSLQKMILKILIMLIAVTLLEE